MKNLTILIFALAALAGCSTQANTTLIERHHQFSMAIGKMEDQIDLIQLPGQPFQQTIDLVMRNGLFYISNGAARKVMEFSSYGDLLTLYYNKNSNPAPVLLDTEASSGSVANRKAFPYPFNELGNIAVTAQGMLLIQDSVAEDRQVWDEDMGTLLRNVILRFSADGELVDYIGQEGVSGTPFGYIDSIEVGVNGVLTVVSRTLEQWIIYTYDPAGMLRYSFVLTDDILPPGEPGDVFSVDAVVAAPASDRIYVKADYYRDQLASENEQESDFRFYKSSIHWFDGPDPAGSLDLPPAVRTSGRAQMLNREEEEIVQFLAGVDSQGYIFLVSPESDVTYSLAVVNLSGQVVHRGTIEFIDEETLYRKFFVTGDGILTALIGGDTEADVVVWRTDKFLGGAE